jgi:hypothetical protein
MDILENPENWMAVMDKKKELGIIEDSEYTAEVSAMQKAKKKYDTLKSEVKQGDRIKLAGLIGDKIAIESKLSDAPELKPKYEKQLSEIETKISNLTNGISDTEAPIEQATDVNIQVQDFREENKQNTNKDEIKTTSTESVNTGQKQDNITRVQQNEQNGGTIQQGNGQNESEKDVEEDSEKWYKAKKTIKDKDGNDIKLTIDKNKDDKHFYIKATDSNGKEVGSALFETSDGEVWSGNEIEVNEANRRKGIMSAMYDFAESEGHPLEPTKTLSKEGKAFWDNRKAPTQYTEASGVSGSALKDVESTAKALGKKRTR